MSVTEVRDPTLCPFAWGGTAFPTGAVPWHPLTSSWCSLPTRLAWPPPWAQMPSRKDPREWGLMGVGAGQT